MAIRTISLDSERRIPQRVLDQFGFQEKEPLKALYGSMGILLLRRSSSLGDILLTLEEIKNLYKAELRELDGEWDDFTIAEEWLGTDV